MLRCLLWVFAAAAQPKALLIADNLCLRQQVLVLQRRVPRPRLEDVDRRFWIFACRWFSGWQTSALAWGARWYAAHQRLPPVSLHRRDRTGRFATAAGA